MLWLKKHLFFNMNMLKYKLSGNLIKQILENTHWWERQIEKKREKEREREKQREMEEERQRERERVGESLFRNVEKAFMKNRRMPENHVCDRDRWCVVHCSYYILECIENQYNKKGKIIDIALQNNTKYKR